MATIGGLSGNTSSLGLYGASNKGFGGLASGLDTDALIEGMTIGTRTKIQKLQQQNQVYQWQMNAYRGISDMLVKFSNKYLDIANPSSPLRSSFFGSNLITASGENSKYLSVTGAGSGLNNMQVLGVKQLASDASRVTNGDASDQKLTTGALDFNEIFTSANLNGGEIKVSFNNTNYTIKMEDGKALAGAPGGKEDYSTLDNAIQSFNAKLATIDTGDGKKLSDKMQAVNDGGHFTLKAINDGDGNLFLKGGSKAQLKMLGLVDSDGKFANDGIISAAGYKGTEELTEDKLVTKKTFAEYVGGKELKFELNGISKSIKMPSQEILEQWENDGADQLSNLRDHLDTELKKAFGNNKIEVTTQGGGLSFETKDGSSVLKLTSNATGLLGKSGVFGVQNGISNRLDMTTSLKDAGFVDANGDVNLEINGIKIEGLTGDSSLKAMMEAINKSDAGVKVSYLETADRFSLVSTVKGAQGAIEINQNTKEGKSNVAHELFGDSVFNVGKDAVMTVRYDGNVESTITRDSNTFSLEGATFNLSQTFGTYGADGKVTSDADAVSFTASVDTEKITKVIGEMVKDYNDIVDAVIRESTTRPEKKYPPLTDEQKKDMSKDEIEKWEAEAKKGMLYNDPLLNSLTNKLRLVFSGAADMGVLKDMGLDMGNSYTSNGKITFDEDKFKSKLQEDPEKIKDLFQRDASGSNGGGFAIRLKAITEEFAKTTGSRKGLLIEKAGSEHAATSLVQNGLKKLMEESTKQIDGFKDKLQTEIYRYNRQFTELEKLVAQMNSQSSYLSSLSF